MKPPLPHEEITMQEDLAFAFFIEALRPPHRPTTRPYNIKALWYARNVYHCEDCRNTVNTCGRHSMILPAYVLLSVFGHSIFRNNEKTYINLCKYLRYLYLSCRYSIIISFVFYKYLCLFFLLCEMHRVLGDPWVYDRPSMQENQCRKQAQL